MRDESEPGPRDNPRPILAREGESVQMKAPVTMQEAYLRMGGGVVHLWRVNSCGLSPWARECPGPSGSNADILRFILSRAGVSFLS